jgi:DNA-binding beta-propeller fold protein YncE
MSTWNSDISFNSDGTSMYVLGGDYNTRIYQYSLGAAWNTRSCTHYSTCSVSNEESIPHGMFFKPDGTKLYVLGTGSDNIYQYALSTAWLLGSATYDEKYFYVGSSENSPTALFFKPDGSKVFFLGQQNKTVYVLSLLTNWDISTANIEAETYDFSSEEIYPHSLWFHNDGLIMYVQGIGKDKIYKYSLSTAWTLPDPWNSATVTLVDSFQISKDEARGIYINPDELKLYTVGVGNVNTYYFNEP